MILLCAALGLAAVSGAFSFSTQPTGLPGNATTGLGLASLMVGFPTAFTQNETQELEGEAAFQPHRRQRVPPAELPEVGNDRRAGGQPAGALAMGWFGGRCHFVLLSVYSVLKLRRRWGFYTRPMPPARP